MAASAFYTEAAAKRTPAVARAPPVPHLPARGALAIRRTSTPTMHRLRAFIVLNVAASATAWSVAAWLALHRIEAFDGWDAATEMSAAMIRVVLDLLAPG